MLARYFLIVLVLASTPLHLRAAERPRIVKTVLRGPHTRQRVATEVLLPPTWQPGQPVLLIVFRREYL